jgi:hypothetical protein
MASAQFTYLSSRSIGQVTTLTYPKANFEKVQYGLIEATQVLPFRIQFTNTQIRGYDSSNPAPLGVAIIGYNFYIL